jgi:hypothetical protein
MSVKEQEKKIFLGMKITKGELKGKEDWNFTFKYK